MGLVNLGWNLPEHNTTIGTDILQCRNRALKTKNENNHGDAEYKENRKIEKGRGI